MENFWDYSVWGTFSIFAVLFGSLLVGNIMKKTIPFLRNSLTPPSVISGIMLIIVSGVYKAVTGIVMFDTALFGGDGTKTLEIVTYHALAIGMIASTLKNTKKKMTKQRSKEIFNTGVTTVATYLLQGILGLGVTLIASLVLDGFFSAAGVLLPFGYGQGTGQALNYGTIYETEYGFDGGKSFGLTIAALGFLSASIGGVFHLNIKKRRGTLITADSRTASPMTHSACVSDKVFSDSLDRMTVQISLIAVVYFSAYGLMYLLGSLLPGLRSVVYGFNFLIGVLMAMLAKTFMRWLRKNDIMYKEYTDDFLLTRTSNFCFDIMIISGIAAIRLDILENYWGIILILGVLGAIFTYAYNRLIAKRLFPDYTEEQFLMMYGMLTGTASTGTILLREIDSEFETPAMDNMIYQNIPAILFGFPMMFLAVLAPDKPTLTLVIFVVLFAVLNGILFRDKWIKIKNK